MSVYVGKDVEVRIQVPVKEDVTRKLIGIHDYDCYNDGNQKAYHHAATSEPTPPFGTELDGGGYNAIKRSDDIRYGKQATVNGEYAIVLFRYKSKFPEADVKKIAIKFEGYGTAPGGNGATMKVWDHVASAWTNAVSGTGGGDETLTITLTTNLGNYIDADGYIWVLVRTTNPSDGTTAATLNCDTAYSWVTKDRFNTLQVPISDRDQDGVANEVAHVTVLKNGSAVTVIGVTDSTGLVVLSTSDLDVADQVFCKYRYDSQPYVAQELTLEPKQAVEGVDGLGSDTIQVWVVLLKEYVGSIKELFKGSISAAARMGTLSTKEVSNDFDNADEAKEWEPVTGTWSISSGQYLVSDWGGMSKRLLADGRNIDARVDAPSIGGGNRPGIAFRVRDVQNYYFIGSDAWTFRLSKYENGVETFIAGWSFVVGYRSSASIRLVVRENVVEGYVDSLTTPKFRVEIDDAYKHGHTGLAAPYVQYSGAIPFDNLSIKPADSESEIGSFGMIAKWESGGSIVRLGFDGVIFPEGSIPSPKSSPIFIVTPFRAQTAKIIA